MRTLLALVLAVVGCSRESPPQPAGHGERVFVVNVAGESVSVIDHEKRAVVATIDLGARPHGLAAAPDGRTVYVTAGDPDGEVIAIDTAFNNVAWRLDVGRYPHQPGISPDGRHLYVPDFAGRQVFVVDVLGRRVAAEVVPLLDGKPLKGLHNAYVGPRGRTVFQTAMYGRALAQIDLATREVRRVDLLPGQPRPAALLPDESKLYFQLSEFHGFIEWDVAAARETRRVAWPEPAGQEKEWTKCHGLGITPDALELWAASDLEHDVRVYSLPGLVEKGQVAVGRLPNWFAFGRDGATVYVTNTGSGTVSVIDRVARRVVATIEVGEKPKRIVDVMVPVPAP